MDMPAYHTLHVLQDVQIENQHEKTKTLLNNWSITYFITEGTHFKRQLIESMHEDPVGYISPWSHPQIILHRKGKARKFGSLCTKAASGGLHDDAFFGATCMSHYWSGGVARFLVVFWLSYIECLEWSILV